MAVYNVKSLSFTKGDNTYNIDAGSSYYAVCSTAGSTQTKTVTIDEITALEEGLSVRIIFSNDQLYNGVPKLQINSLAAANIQSVAGVDGEQYMWKAGEVIDLVYNGTNWIVVGRGATPSTRIIQVNTTVTNTSGSYTTTIQDTRITSDMKALSLEISNPYVFNDKITVTCTNGSVTFACNDVCGTSAVTINIVKAALDATTITSEEFDTLDAEKLDKTDFFATEMPMSSSDNTKVAAAISAIESDLDDKQDATDNNLSTTAKTVVGAINENASGITSNSEAISNLDIANVSGVTIASLCNSCPENKHKYYYIADSNGITDFPTTTRMYRNYISISKFDGENNRANVEISGKTGSDVVRAFEGVYENGTFYWSELATTRNVPKYKTFNFTNISVSAGAIGERGAQASADLGYVGHTCGIVVTYISDSSLCIPVVFLSGTKVYVNLYRTSTAAQTVTVELRVLYFES